MELIEENQDIINKAFGKVSKFVERDDLVNEIYLLLAKHLDVSRLEHNNQFRQYLSKVAYQVTSLQLKAHSIPTSVISGGTSGSLRRMAYEKLEEIQKDIFRRAKEKSSSLVDPYFSNFDFYTDLSERLDVEALGVAEMLSEGYTVTEVSKRTGLTNHMIRGRIIPKIQNAMTKRKV